MTILQKIILNIFRNKDFMNKFIEEIFALHIVQLDKKKKYIIFVDGAMDRDQEERFRNVMRDTDLVMLTGANPKILEIEMED